MAPPTPRPQSSSYPKFDAANAGLSLNTAEQKEVEEGDIGAGTCVTSLLHRSSSSSSSSAAAAVVVVIVTRPFFAGSHHLRSSRPSSRNRTASLTIKLLHASSRALSRLLFIVGTQLTKYARHPSTQQLRPELVLIDIFIIDL